MGLVQDVVLDLGGSWVRVGVMRASQTGRDGVAFRREFGA